MTCSLGRRFLGLCLGLWPGRGLPAPALERLTPLLLLGPRLLLQAFVATLPFRDSGMCGNSSSEVSACHR